jgi:hypothetical protein
MFLCVSTCPHPLIITMRVSACPTHLHVVRQLDVDTSEDPTIRPGRLVPHTSPWHGCRLSAKVCKSSKPLIGRQVCVFWGVWQTSLTAWADQYAVTHMHPPLVAFVWFQTSWSETCLCKLWPATSCCDCLIPRSDLQIHAMALLTTRYRGGGVIYDLPRWPRHGPHDGLANKSCISTFPATLFT